MRRALATGSLAVATGLALAACVDLFHSTDYALDEDAEAAPPPAEAGADVRDAAPVLREFCKMTAEEGKALAVHACALLSACETPLGRNATGRCLEKALPIMACAGAPDRPASGAVLAFYRCLAVAKTCEDVDRCVFPVGKPPKCGASAPFTACGDSIGQQDVRVDCRTSGSPASGGEVCVAYGQECALDLAAGSRCVGTQGVAGCKRTGCDGSGHLHLCVDAGGSTLRDEGFDCNELGGSCHETDGGVFGCATTIGGIGCPPSASVTCRGSVATGCPAGVEELVDCKALFDTPCRALDGGAREVAWDVARACNVLPDAGACASDTCSGATLYACVRGKPIMIDCAQAVGTTCTRVDTTDEKGVATCAAP